MYVRVEGGRVRVPVEVEREGDKAVERYVASRADEDVLPFASANRRGQAAPEEPEIAVLEEVWDLEDDLEDEDVTDA